MNLQGGEYLLSLGVTGYEEDDFTVYHRLYDTPFLCGVSQLLVIEQPRLLFFRCRCGILSDQYLFIGVDHLFRRPLAQLRAGFNNEYNGIENIYLNGTMIGFTEKEIDEKLDSILEFADIGEYVYRLSYNL